MRGLSLIKFLEISTIRIVATPLPQFDCLVSLCLGRTIWNGVSALFEAFLLVSKHQSVAELVDDDRFLPIHLVGENLT